MLAIKIYRHIMKQQLDASGAANNKHRRNTSILIGNITYEITLHDLLIEL